MEKFVKNGMCREHFGGKIVSTPTFGLFPTALFNNKELQLQFIHILSQSNVF
jgi:hypothetical protein